VTVVGYFEPGSRIENVALANTYGDVNVGFFFAGMVPPRTVFGRLSPDPTARDRSGDIL
jgi:hypothetical protein